MSRRPGPDARVSRNPVIAIDGPAGSGKSSTAKAVARRLGFRHLDSGSLYRALTLALLRRGVPEEDWDRLTPEALDDLDIEVAPTDGGFRVLLGGKDPGGELRSERVTRLVPLLARESAARARLSELQRSARDHGGLVADGRDMGTVVFPDADLKVFLTASLRERAKRRLLQDDRPTDPPDVRREAERIGERDTSDTDRAVAPLRKAEGALEIDTTDLAFETQVERIVEAAAGLTGGSGHR